MRSRSHLQHIISQLTRSLCGPPKFTRRLRAVILIFRRKFYRPCALARARAGWGDRLPLCEHISVATQSRSINFYSYEWILDIVDMCLSIRARARAHSKTRENLSPSLCYRTNISLMYDRVSTRSLRGLESDIEDTEKLKCGSTNLRRISVSLFARIYALSKYSSIKCSSIKGRTKILSCKNQI